MTELPSKPAPTAIVVDDEPLARSRLKRLLNGENIEVVAEAENGEEAVELAGKIPADMMFIDIQMPIMDGLTAVSKINAQYEHPPAIVFCTAYDEYAIAAFKTNAVAYLLKPVSAKELRQSIASASKVNRIQLASVENAAPITINVATISVHVGGSLEKLDMTAFSSFRSHEKNVFGKLIEGTEVMVNYTLKELEEIFSYQVIRVHRSALVNKSLMQSLALGATGTNNIVLTDESVFPVSRRHLSEVKKCFN